MASTALITGGTSGIGRAVANQDGLAFHRRQKLLPASFEVLDEDLFSSAFLQTNSRCPTVNYKHGQADILATLCSLL